MTPFENATVIITGAGSGIGRQLTIQAAAQGAQVIATDVNEAGLAETARLAGDNVETQPLDVSDPTAIRLFAEETLPTLDDRLLILVNNAGVALGSGPFAETELDDFEWLLSINLWGVIRMTKAFLPYLIMQNEGHIVNVSSVFGLAGVMNQSAYCTAKFGVRGFTDTLRMELMDTNIGVTCVHPGGIKTNIATNARIGRSGFVTDAMHKQGAVSFEKAARTTAEAAARQIWEGVRRNKARVLIGADARQIDWVTRMFPTSYVGMIRDQMEKAFSTGV
ncbi:SDR family NAD(P)-dependent oxidoreductase [Fibrisoma montanum]|uniref:SDR family NAD(P)-dependent oxidoreductase n=1 Tax=Fibrisoma montanum TaxID=2305895 RepID=A0A418M0I0_9BACT|nr:SDR family NAD(P)-dependent oxidoreductase [Fibrisoma montanum]RIV19086.1 SDR family NAD(P)-dependent oxidoreductase [Fibrisoma montanum]